MEHVTAEQCRAIVKDKGFRRVGHHRCTLCGYQTAYVFDGDAVYFDPGCDCTYGRNVRPSSYESLAETFNRQTPEIRAHMWEDFQAGKALIDQLP